MLSVPLIRYVLMAALRDRLVLTLSLLIVLGSCLSVFLGSSAVVEADQFSLVFAAGGLRMAGAIGLVLFAVFHVRRSFDGKDVEFLLARPISRTAFILSLSAAFSILALILGLAVGLAIAILAGGKLGEGHFLWIFSLIMEFMIVINAALFFSMVVSSASGAAFSVIGLYVLGRLMGELLGDAQHSVGMAFAQFSRPLMNGISMFMPRIDLFAQTTWLVYPQGGHNVGYAFILLQGLLYSGLLVCAAVIDLRRRQF
jgi:hypothetical protein